MTAPTITRSSHPSNLWPGIFDFYGNEYEKWPAEWSKIFTKRTGTKAFEKLVRNSGFGIAPKKDEGASITYDTDAEGPTNIITQVVYGLGYVVTREEMEDDQYVDASEARAGNLAFSMNTTAEMVHANVLNRGFSGAYTYGDGVPLFSASHPAPGGLQSNLLTPADFSEAAVEDMGKTISRMTNDRGLPMMARPSKLVVGSDYQFDVNRVLNSSGMPGTANNDINPVKGIFDDVIVSHYLTDPDSWYIITSIPKGLISIWRRQPQLEKDNDFDTENVKAKSTMRFGCGVGDWRAIFGNTGS